MDEELSSTLKQVKVINEYEEYNLHIYEVHLYGTICYLTVCGVGKVNASRSTQILIDLYDVNAIINVGVAGGISNNLKVGDIIVSDKLVQHDFDITAFDHNKGYIPNVGIYMPCDNRLVSQTIESLNILKYNYYVGVIASGDIFLTDKKMSEKIHAKFNALCAEMEGAAIAQVCTLSNIPFIVIRSISDVPNKDNNVREYKEFLESSASKLSNIVLELIKQTKSNQ